MRRVLPALSACRRLAMGAALLLAACGQPAIATSSGQQSSTASPVAATEPAETPSTPPAPVATTSPTPSPTPTFTAPTLPRASGIKVPAGFTAYVYARGISQPSAMAFGPDGRLYITGATGQLSVVVAPGASPRLLLSGLPPALGLVWRDNQLFVSVHGGVLSYTLNGETLSGGDPVVSGLPAGEHQTDNLVILDNGDFLVGLGSTCDHCAETDPRSATVLRFHSDWSYGGIVVRGARNPFGLAVRRSTGEAYVTINGQDSLGPAQPADQLLKVSDGEDAGWPGCWPAYPGGLLHGACDGVAPPVALFPAHSSADGILFYDATQFGAEYQDNAFVTEWGTYFGTSPGRKVVRVVLAGGASGQEQGTVTDFAGGFQHPLALSQAPDGGLLVGDYGTGQLIEIFRTG